MKGNSMKRKKRIALVAHDERKGDLLERVKYNKKNWQHTNCGPLEQPEKQWVFPSNHYRIPEIFLKSHEAGDNALEWFTGGFITASITVNKSVLSMYCPLNPQNEPASASTPSTRSKNISAPKPLAKTGTSGIYNH